MDPMNDRGKHWQCIFPASLPPEPFLFLGKFIHMLGSCSREGDEIALSASAHGRGRKERLIYHCSTRMHTVDERTAVLFSILFHVPLGGTIKTSTLM